MSWVTDVVVGAAVVIGVVGGMIWLAKRGTFQPDANEATEDRAELEESVGRQDFQIPFRRRVSAWSGPYKVFVGSLVLLSLLGGFATYRIMKTGAPAQAYVTREVRYAIVGVVGIAGGARLYAWFDAQIGHLFVTYERAGEDPLVEKIPYARTRETRRDGKVRIPEVAQERLFGLFWRFRQVGEDRRLRGTDKPLDDVITQQVPDHAAELPDGSGWLVTTHEDGDRVLEGATSAADVTYSSPNSLSDERAIQIREKQKRKNAELQAVKATNAELYGQIRKMRKKIENEEYQDRTELMDDLEDFSSFLSTFRVEMQDGTSKNGDDSALESDGQEAKA